jgi:hypothetical protein
MKLLPLLNGIRRIVQSLFFDSVLEMLSDHPQLGSDLQILLIYIEYLIEALYGQHHSPIYAEAIG